jgi:hypothetical protein
MWQVYQTGKTFGQRPSSLLRDDDKFSILADPWWAFQFDNAVALVGGALEAATKELENSGTDKNPKWGPRYSVEQLLDPDFRLGDDRLLTPEKLMSMGLTQ